MKNKVLSMLVLLAAVATGVWADELQTSYTSPATLNNVTVSDNMEVTIASGKTLTVKGPGTLVANGTAGVSGEDYSGGGNPGTGGGAAISGDIIVQGATVNATGGNGVEAGWSNQATAGSAGNVGKASASSVTFENTPTALTDGSSAIAENQVTSKQTVNIEGAGVEPVPTGYTVSLKEGTVDADKWTITPNPATAGATVTATYSGTKRVKSVKAVKKAAAPAAHALSEATAEDVGKVIGANGMIYNNATAATNAGTIARAIIAYVGSEGSVDASSDTYKGLAIAMEDANSGSTCAWYSAFSGTCVSQTTDIATALGYKNGIASTNTMTSDSHTHASATTAKSNNDTAQPTGTSDWFLPTLGQWNLIVQGLATKEAGSAVTTDLTTSANDTYKSSNLNSVITDAGGTGFQSGYYWSSTEYNTMGTWYVRFNEGLAISGTKTQNYYVRSVLAF